MWRWSYSSLQSWRKCQHRAYLDKTTGTDTGFTPAREVGTLFHRFVEHVNLALIDVETSDEARATATAVLADTAAEASHPDIRADLEEIAVAWLSRTDLLSLRTGAAEWRFAFDADWRPVDWDSTRARIRGIIDRIEVEHPFAEVRDYKTSRRPAADWLQCELYGFAAMRMDPSIQTVDLVLDFVRYDYQPRTSRSRSELAWVPETLTRQMDEADKAIRAHEQAGRPLSAHPGPWCGDCAWHASCPAMQAVLRSKGYSRELQPPRDREEAREQSELADLLDAAAERLKEHRKSFVFEHGSVDAAEGQEFRVISGGKWRAQPRAIVSRLLKAGLPVDAMWERLHLSKKDAQALAVAAGVPWDEIETLGTEDTTVSVRRVRRVGT